MDKKVKQIIASNFGFDAEKVAFSDIRGSVEKDVMHFIQQTAEGQVFLYTSSRYEVAMLQRQVIAFVQDTVKKDYLLGMTTHIDESFTRSIKKFFSPTFGWFSNGVASSYGRFLTRYLRYVSEEPGYFDNTAHWIRIHNHMMSCLEKRSRSQNVVKARSNDRMWKVFEEENKRFCQAVFAVESRKYEAVKNGDGLGSVNPDEVFQQIASMAENAVDAGLVN